MTAIASAAAPWHALPAEVAAERLATDPRRGLAPEEAARRLARHGPNELREEPPPPSWKRFLAQFNELVIWILLAAAAIAGALGEWIDALAILAIVVMNGVLGFVQEERAGRALAALRRLSAPLARVIRGGAAAAIPARDLVPGDLIELEAGDHVPADARLVEAFGARVLEAALTGESTPSEKAALAAVPADAPLGDRRTCVYLGTVAVGGKATAIVTATGMATELGKIAGVLARFEPEPTPLQRRLAELGRVIVWLCVASVLLVAGVQLARGGPLLEVFMLAVSLAVVAVPEGLPAVVTVALALGLQRMVRRHALVRKLPSVETLGCVTVICTDKTGTLTRNEMTLERLIAGRRAYAVTGSGYAPRGRFLEDGGRPVDPGEAPDLALALTAGARCNHARLTMRADRDDVWEVVGDPTEGALLVAAEKAGIGTADGAAPRVVFEIPFDSDRKAMSVVVEEPGGARAMYVKGAPEVIVAKCDRERAGGADVALDAARREAILAAGAALAARGLRVLALAWKPIGAAAPPYEESGLAFLGLAGMRDPPREEAREAVARCHGAGIRPIMITGDHPQTALAIARELGIAAEGDRVTTGQELDRTADDRLLAELERVPVYARVAAEHKLRIVRAWKQRGEIVAMTGDGVNDATAVKAADIGIAMGITGTDVTKEAADMVLTDDNFASIVNAVEEGRGIFDNIQKFVFYLLCCNFGAIVLMLVASLAGWPAPLFPMQLLWINLVTNGLPALAMALEPPEPGIMQRRPRRPNEPMFSAHRATRIALEGALIGLVAIAGFFAVYGRGPAFLGAARTTAFCLLVFADLLFAIAARSASLPLVRLGLTTNPWLLAAILGSAALQLAVVAIPWLGRVFETVSWREVPWWIVGPGAVLPFAAVEAMKMLRGEEAARR